METPDSRGYRTETWPIGTRGYVAARFIEFSSRAEDPNSTRTWWSGTESREVDGVWRALDGRLLSRHKLAAG